MEKSVRLTEITVHQTLIENSAGIGSNQSVKNPDTVPRPIRLDQVLPHDINNLDLLATLHTRLPRPPRLRSRGRTLPQSDRLLCLENPLLVDSQPGALRPGGGLCAVRASHWTRSTGTAMCHYPATSELSPMTVCG